MSDQMTALRRAVQCVQTQTLIAYAVEWQRRERLRAELAALQAEVRRLKRRLLLGRIILALGSMALGWSVVAIAAHPSLGHWAWFGLAAALITAGYCTLHTWRIRP